MCSPEFTGDGVNCYGKIILHNSTISNHFVIIILFLDIDECAINTHDCDNLTTFCSNNFGNFDCLCLSGYVNPNGTSCDRKPKLIHHHHFIL